MLRQRIYPLTISLFYVRNIGLPIQAIVGGLSSLVQQERLASMDKKYTICGDGVSVDRPLYHPAFEQPDTSTVFHSLTRAVSVLKQLKTQESESLLNEAKCLLQKENAADCNKNEKTESQRHPLIVIEGLDGAGKSTLCQFLSSHIGAISAHAPPDRLTKWRPYFDQQSQLVRRAYFTLGNFMAADEIEETLKTKPVIIDRYWHSTTAYTIAREVSEWGVTGLPPHGHWVYAWPDSLLRPTIALYLDVPEDIRMDRITSRAEEITSEERKLQNTTFREALCEAYKRFNNPSMMIIDASKSRDDVLMEAINAIESVS